MNAARYPGDIYFYDCKYDIDEVLTQLVPNESDITATAASTHATPDTSTPSPSGLAPRPQNRWHSSTIVMLA